MATKRRLPMVGDSPTIAVQVQDPDLQVTLRVREELSSKEGAWEFDWEAYAGLIMAALIVPRTSDDLVDYWKANANMLDWAKKVKPDIFERIRLAFADRKTQILGAQNG